MSSVQEKLATLLADAALRRQRGEAMTSTLDGASQLAIELGSDPDPSAFDTFFELLAGKLAATGAHLPPVDELPPAIAPVVAAFGHAFTFDKDGNLDFERTARRAERAMEKRFGTSTRKVQRAKQRARIRSEVAASVAESLRQHGLTPACDDDE